MQRHSDPLPAQALTEVAREFTALVSPRRTFRRWCTRCYRCVLALALAGGAGAGCGSRPPSAEAAEAAMRSTIDNGSEVRLRMVSFQKTDGRAMEVMGVKAYDIIFRADAEFVSNAMFSVGMPLVSEGSQITTSDYRAPAAGFSWDDFLSSSQGARRASKGDRLRLTGSVSFEARESGWVATGARFTFEHDLSGPFVGRWVGTDDPTNCLVITPQDGQGFLTVFLWPCADGQPASGAKGQFEERTIRFGQPITFLHNGKTVRLDQLFLEQRTDSRGVPFIVPDGLTAMYGWRDPDAGDLAQAQNFKRTSK